MYDRAFDRGLIGFDESMRVILSPRLRIGNPPILHRQALLELDGRAAVPSGAVCADPAAIAWHREHVFMTSAVRV